MCMKYIEEAVKNILTYKSVPCLRFCTTKQHKSCPPLLKLPPHTVILPPVQTAPLRDAKCL